MKIAVTGAGGLVGSALCRQLSLDADILALRHTDLDITSRRAVNEFVGGERPDVIINCAVVNVDECETDQTTAKKVNVDGPRHLAQAVNEYGGDLIHYSTNYVFDGEGERVYTTDDSPHPVNNYGVTKLAGEREVETHCPRHIIIRTSWVYGIGKQNFLGRIHQLLREGKHSKVVKDCWASSTYAEDLGVRTCELLKRRVYGTYHVVNSGICSYLDFAVEAGRQVGLRDDEAMALMELVSDADLKRPARRPRYTPLRCLLSERLGLPPLRNWKDALAEYVQSNW